MFQSRRKGEAATLLPKERLVFYKHVRLLALPARKRGAAERLVRTVLAIWLERKYPRIPRAGLETTKSLLNRREVQSFAGWLENLDLVDAAFWLCSAYARWVGDDVRRNRAMFFTPPILSARLIENLRGQGVDFSRDSFMDPACGGAAFLLPIALAMRSALMDKGKSPEDRLTHISSQIVGIDIDPTLCCLSSYFLKMALYSEIVEVGRVPRFRLRVANALDDKQALRGKIDVVLCNPPYRKMLRGEVERWTKRFGEIMEGQPNLYGLFFGVSLGFLKPGGIAALLTPTSYLSGQYFSKLRTYLLSNADTKQIDIVSARNGVFVDVEIETAITILRRRIARVGRRSSTRIYALDQLQGCTSLGTQALPNSGTAWPVPRCLTDAKAIAIAKGSPYRLMDYGFVSRVGALVWNRDKRRRFNSEETACRAGKAPFPIIWSSNITAAGRLTFEPDEKHSFVDMKHSAHQSVVREPCIALQRVTSSDQRRRLVSAAVSSSILKRYGGIVGENHVVLLEQKGRRVPISPSQLSRVLRSDLIDRLYRCISGAANVSVFELSQLPMPSPVMLALELGRTKNVDVAVRRAFLATTKGQRK